MYMYVYNKSIYATLIAGLMILFVQVAVVRSQCESTGESDLKKGHYADIVRNNGWTIPNRSDWVLTKVADYNECNKRLKLKTYRLLNKKSIIVETYKITDNFTLNASTTRAEIVGITEVWSDTRLFLIIINYQPLGTFASGNKPQQKAYVGPTLSFGYLDSDGDGLYETRYDSSRPGFRIPAWITKN